MWGSGDLPIGGDVTVTRGTTGTGAEPGRHGSRRRQDRVVSVIGYDGSPLTAAARKALQEASLVVGGIRHLDAVGVPDHARRLYMGDLQVALTQLAVAEGPAAVVASGDPGFFGVVRALRARQIPIRVYPAISSVAAAFARVGVPWDDAVVVSAHGGEATPERDMRRVANVCRAHPKVAVLTGPGAGPRELAELLCQGSAPGARISRSFVIAQNLGEAEERVQWMSLEEAAEQHAWDDPNVVLVLDEARLVSPRGWLSGWAAPENGWALPENAFVHRASMITKSEVRAVALAKLGPRPGMMIWDVGAGSGSIGIECARMGAAVIAIERDADSGERIDLNATMHGVEVVVVRGHAPDVLLDLPQPDAVFIGGGGLDVVRHCLNRDPRIVVVALVAIDRVAEVKRELKQAGRKVDGVLLQASRLAPLPGDAHRFNATNPVFILWGERT